jgi:hypothetical protein
MNVLEFYTKEELIASEKLSKIQKDIENFNNNI